MNLSVGIVGLPNVGKSTLFNAMTNNQVDSANYPFCTIEPNKGIIPVEDENLDKLALISKSQKKINAVIEFVDIAGLVKGASQGAGLGNQFLANIREVAAIAHVVRDFEDDEIIHVEGRINPVEDIDTIETELILKDMETMNKKMGALRKYSKFDTKLQEQYSTLEKLAEHLGKGKLAINFPVNPELEDLMRELSLLTYKPVVYVINKKQGEKSKIFEELLKKGKNVIEMDVRLEYEISKLDDNEKNEFLGEFGLESPGLVRLSQIFYDALELISFYTSGEQETRAWTIKKGTKAPQAAGVIHTDFEKKFISAEVISLDDFIKYNGWNGAKDAGKMRLEGREYVFSQNDVVIIRHG